MANEFTYRADHIGSLVVPAALSEARKRHAAGADALRDAENVAIEAAVAMQRQVGIGVTTDGGFRRADHAVISLDGSKLAKSEGAPLKALSKRPIKVAVPAARRAPGEMLEQALARAGIVKQEIEALIAAGVDYVQLDTPGYAGPGQVFDELLQLDTAVLSGIVRPNNVRISINVVHHDNAIDLRAIERVFQTMPVDRFMLPLDAASKTFDGLGRVPKGKLVVLGLISTANVAPENVDDVLTWIDEAAKVMDGDDLALSPASGFAGSALSEADQKRKLELIADAAMRFWGFAM